MKEVFLSNYLQEEAKKSLVTSLAWVVFAMILLVAGIVTGVTLLITLSTVAFTVSVFVVTRHCPTYATYHCGEQGEQVLRDHLQSAGLSDEYTAYYNLPTNGNGRISDIDCILAGPPGLFVIEVKHHRGLVFYRDGIWTQIKVGRRGTPYRGHLGDPSAQLSRNIRKLKALLIRADADAPWLHGVIVFTNAQAFLDIEGLRWVKAVSVKDLDQVLSGTMKLSTDQLDRINTCLSAFMK